MTDTQPSPLTTERCSMDDKTPSSCHLTSNKQIALLFRPIVDRVCGLVVVPLHVPANGPLPLVGGSVSQQWFPRLPLQELAGE